MPGERNVRGLGWDINSSFSANKGDLLPARSFGHTGFTGTSLWVDPGTKTFIVFLSNRVHPDGKGDVTALRARVANVVGGAIRIAPAPVVDTHVFGQAPASGSLPAKGFVRQEDIPLDAFLANRFGHNHAQAGVTHLAA